MTEKNKKKQSPVGCLIYLGIIIIAFVFFPWQVALGLAFFLFAVILLTSGIGSEIKKIRRRNITQKSNISNANYGYTELVAKVSPSNKNLKSWIDGEAADYRWISFLQYQRTKNSDGESSGSWGPFYDDESEDKLLRISDGSGQCYASLHMADFRLHSKIKRYKPEEFLTVLKERRIDNFPYDLIDPEKDIRVEEKWIPKNAEHFFYGHMQIIKKEVPEDLIKVAEQAWRGGDHLNKKRQLDANDWKSILENSQQSAKVLTTNYDQDPVDNIIISQHDDNVLNRWSYISILAMVFGLVIVFVIGYLALNASYPEIIDEILFILNL